MTSAMTNPSEPQTDRELLILINDHVSKITIDIKEIKEKIENKPDKEYCVNQHGAISTRLNDHSVRIRKLEAWRWYLAGGIAVAAFLISFFLK